LTDYCVYPESSSPGDTITNPADETVDLAARVDTPAPSAVGVISSPTGSPTASSGNQISLQHVGWSPPADKMPLGLCQGDCDDDSDCQDGLVCFQRFLPMTGVPGCLGGESDTSLMDFCIQDPTKVSAPTATLTQTNAPSVAAIVVPATPTVPTVSDVTVSRTDAPGGVPPPIDCSAYSALGVNLSRLCKADPFECCQNPRSSSNYCHEIYRIFGDDIYSACHHCCLQEERQEALVVGPPNTPKPGLAPYESCDTLENTARLCKAESCCDVGFDNTGYCQSQWAAHRGNVEAICWYCCFPSKEYPEPSKRYLLADGNSSSNFMEERHVVALPGHANDILESLEEKVDFTEKIESEDLPPVQGAMTKDEMRLFHKNNPREIGPGDKIIEHPISNQKLIVRKENFGGKGEKDEDAYHQELYEAYKQRELQTTLVENYSDVFWWPYEWLFKVGTEYYFRYEGSMTVPPCYTVNHWRVLKDPIRVAAHQIRELERLLAWRLNSKCEADTAGKPREGNPDAVDVNRPLQELEIGHRMVFCECQDWPSKFPGDREWCKKWQSRDPELRLFDNPYNWPQNGF
jgi:hypothetical protein